LWFPPQIVLALDLVGMLTMQPIKLEKSPSPQQQTGPGVGFRKPGAYENWNDDPGLPTAKGFIARRH
jgi:hypothetical protein